MVNQTGGIDIDKPWIAVDPGTGNVYVSYTHFTVNTQTFSVVDSIVFQRSLDRGATWERDLITLSSDATAGLVQGSRPAVGPDGEVYVAWKEIGKTDADYMRIRKSTNHGASFGPEATVASFYDNFGTGAPGYNRLRGITFPSIAIGKGDVPPTHWFHMVRTYPAACGGQSLTSLATKVKTIAGEQFSPGYYEWNGLRYVAGSGDVALDRAAYGGITASNPFPPLPPEFGGQYLGLRFTFLYNPDPNQADLH